MPPPTCVACHKRVKKTVYGRCIDCYEEAVKQLGELALVAEASNTLSETYEYVKPDRVYATFFRWEKEGSLYLVKNEGRKWCICVEYADGFPCPPKVFFVSPYNHADANPVWWPKTTFASDPVKGRLDLPFLADRSALRAGLARGNLDNLRPKTHAQFEGSATASRMSYDKYLEWFADKKSTLENGTNPQVHDILKKWVPSYYVATIAPRIKP